MEEAFANYKDAETLVAITIFILLAIAITAIVYIFTNILDKKKKFSFWLLIKSVLAFGVFILTTSRCIKIVKTVSENVKMIE